MASSSKHRSMNSLEKLFATMEFSDVTFEIRSSTAEGEEDVPDNLLATKIKAHKNVLAASSPVFAAMFFGDLKEKDTVTIVDNTAEGLQNTFRYIYTNKFDSSSLSLVMDTLNVARKYLVLELDKRCRNIVANQISTDNMFDILSYALSKDDVELIRKCTLLIAAKTEFDKDSILKITWRAEIRTLKHILELNLINFSPADLYNSLSIWSEIECSKRNIKPTSQNRRDVLGDLLYYIQYSSMSWEDLGHVVLKHDLLNDTEMLEIIKLVLKKEGEEPFATFLKAPTHTNRITVHPFSLAKLVFDSVRIKPEEDYVLHYVEVKNKCHDTLAPSVCIITEENEFDDGIKINLSLEECKDGVSLTTIVPVLLNAGKTYSLRLDPTLHVSCTNCDVIQDERKVSAEFVGSITVTTSRCTADSWGQPDTPSTMCVISEICLMKMETELLNEKAEA